MKLRIAAFLILIAALASCDAQNRKVGIQPFTGVDVEVVEAMQVSIENKYGYDVVILPELGMPEGSFTDVKSPRYRADKIIAHLKDTKPDTIDFVIGCTHHDISTTKRDKDGKVKEPASKYEDWGVFGLGYKGDVSSVLSTFRLGHNDQAVFMSRIQKVSVHELGHNHGLGHCSSKDCVMQDAAESISTIDGVELNLCEACSGFVSP